MGNHATVVRDLQLAKWWVGQWCPSEVTVTGNDSGIAGQPVNGAEKLGHWGVAVQDKAIVLIRGI